MFRQTTIPILALIWSASLIAAENTDAPSVGKVDYGSVYVEDSKQDRNPDWELGVHYSYELSNPYLNIQGGGISVTHALGDFARFGVEGTVYSSSETDLLREVNNSLNALGGSQQATKPAFSTYGTFSVIPLSGYLNFFGNQPLPFDFTLTAGAGVVHYEGTLTEGAVLWRLSPELRLSSRLGIQLSFGQEIEAPWNSSDRLVRLVSGAGLTFAFP